MISVGDVFSNWTVIDISQSERINGYKIKCQCVCGFISFVQKKYLFNGSSKSCGCFGVYVGAKIFTNEVVDIKQNHHGRRSVVLKCTHGILFESRVKKNGVRNNICPCDRVLGAIPKHAESGVDRTPEYNTWRIMRQRCNNPKHQDYENYGGRGIKVCERWDNYKNFLSDMGRRPLNHSIDRINNDGDYEPSNCRWADAVTQRNNQRARQSRRAA